MLRVPSLFLLAGLASATTYELSAYAPGTNVSSAKLNAASEAFYSGLSHPETYCPAVVGDNCPPVDGTLVYWNMAAMAVEVPGGQQIYVQSDGQVKYTIAHSDSTPPGSFTSGWFNKTVVFDCSPERLTLIDFRIPGASSADGLYLCPKINPSLNSTRTTYQLYAETPGFNLTDCQHITGLVATANPAQFGCWEYE